MTATHDAASWRQYMRRGDRGVDVAYWQAALLQLGFDLAGDDAGDFQAGTHNATLAFQRLHGLAKDGVVGPQTRAQISTEPAQPPAEPSLEPTDDDAVPFVQARWFGAQRALSSVRLIVLHCTESPEASTRAERCAAYFARRDDKASAHRVFDDDSEVQCVALDRVAYHAPGANHDGVGYEHVGYARQTAAQWLDPFSMATLRRSAARCAKDALALDIPLIFVDADGLQADNPAGVTTHHEVTKAFGRSKHHDPGPNFPIGHYLGWAREGQRLLVA